MNETERDRKHRRDHKPVVTIRVSGAVRERVIKLCRDANHKELGRKISPSDVISMALALLTEEHMRKLQETSLSNSDRFELRYREHCKRHGLISRDQFLGQIMTTSETVAT